MDSSFRDPPLRSRRRLAALRGLRAVLVAALILVLSGPRLAAAAPRVAGADEAALADAFAAPEIVTVERLADDAAPGSLRWAVSHDLGERARVVVFAVSGEIALERPLELTRPRTWIAGQTAPLGAEGGGVTLTGHPLVLRAGLTIVEHLRVRPGPAPDGRGDEQDGVRIGASVRGDMADIVLRNLSVSWSADELLAIAPRKGETISRVSVIACLFAEPLLDGGHPKGAHNYGVFLRRGARDVLLAGNAISGATRRLPTIEQAASAAVVNNLMSNWGVKPPVHALFKEGLGADYAEPEMVLHLQGNAAQAGPQTLARTARALMSAFADRPRGYDGAAGLQLYASDNRLDGEAVEPPQARPWLTHLTDPPFAIPGWAPWPASQTRDRVLAGVGAWPSARDAVDARIVAAIHDGADVWVERPAAPPRVAPIRATVAAPRSGPALRRWLAARHVARGGMPGA